MGYLFRLPWHPQPRRRFIPIISVGTPSAPSALVAVGIGLDIMLSWTDNSSNETTFRIERRTLPSGSFAEIGSTATDVREYNDAWPSVSLIDSYEYRVRARNASGDSAYSNVATAQSVSQPFVRIGGYARPIKDQTLSVDLALGARSSASFVILDASGTLDLELCTRVEIRHSNSPIAFRGFIQSVGLTRNPATGSREHVVECMDCRYLMEKRLIKKRYTSSAAITILDDILDTLLIEESIYLGTYETGPLIDDFPLNYETAASAVDRLAELSGFYSTLQHGDTAETLDFKSFGGASVRTFDSTNVYGQPTVSRQNPRYRNKQYALGDVAVAKVAIAFGDGEKRAFTVQLPILTVPTVETDIGAGFAGRTVGIDGVDLPGTKAWYWNKGSNVIKQDDAGTVLGVTHRIRTTYTGQNSIAVVDTDAAEVTAHQAREGPGRSGIVEAMEEVLETTTQVALENQATGLLARWGAQGRRISFLTRDHDSLWLADRITIDLPEIDILNNSNFFVEAISYRDVGRRSHAIGDASFQKELDVTVSAFEDVYQPGWTEYFKRDEKRIHELENIKEVAV